MSVGGQRSKVKMDNDYVYCVSVNVNMLLSLECHAITVINLNLLLSGHAINVNLLWTCVTTRFSQKRFIDPKDVKA